jgi:DNA ligase (NAD+)
LEVPSAFLVDNIEDIMRLYNHYVVERREYLDYDIDGLVIEIDDTEKAFSVGTDPAHPEYAIAFKFPHAEGETTLRAVEWQVGNTGRVTPVAVFDEVTLAGARINRASLATVGLLKGKGLEIGSKIVVSRRNDVIPMVERAVTKGISPINIPHNCPSCGHALEIEGEYIICPNIGACPAQIQGAVLNYTKKIGVLEWGDTVVKAMCDSGLVRDLSDIYFIDVLKLASVEMESGRILGIKTATKMFDNLNDKLRLPLHVFVGALGIKGVGRTMCKLLVDAGYNTIEKMRSANVMDIARVEGFGPIRAEEFVAGLQEREGIINDILGRVKIEKPSSGAMNGKSVCMTGFRDADMASEIERQGGSIKSSVGKGLTYLVQKDASSVTEKSKKALELGVKVISIENMWRILGK